MVSRAVAAATLFDTDGINIRFLNSPTGADHVNSQHAATECIDRVQFNGLTPLGRSLSSKVIEPFVLGPARSGQLRKPVLVIAITDGEPVRFGGFNRSSADTALIITHHRPENPAMNWHESFDLPKTSCHGRATVLTRSRSSWPASATTWALSASCKRLTSTTRLDAMLT